MSGGKVDVLAVMDRSRAVVREASDAIDAWETARDHMDTFAWDSPERDAAVKAYNAAAARKQAALDAGWRNSKQAEEASAAVAELIEADREYDAAHLAIKEAFGVGAAVNESHPMVQRILRADKRRAAALARIGGAP